jgi:DNA-binding SARP family transcriptional activator/tetratricopeptide (TPR) repeat protein
MTTRVAFQLLGPVTALNDGRALDLSSPTAKAVLAALLLRGDAGMSLTELVVSAWGQAGATTRDSVYHYISGLRTLLADVQADAVIVSRRPGYRLIVDDDTVDWRRFQRLAACARQAWDGGDLDRAAALLDDARRLWAGPPLAGIGERLGRDRLDMAARRLAMLEDLAAIEAARGHPERVVDLLSEDLTASPERERGAVLMIEALAALGRRDEAGHVYRRTRTFLAEEFGLDPSDMLESTHRAVLQGTSRQARAVGAWVGQVPPVSGLPRPDAHFTGRQEELSQVLAAFHPSVRGETASICTIDGMAGVGKTALAVRAASQLTDQFPDGCLFIDLHGYTGECAPVPAAEALDRLLCRLGVSGDHVPRDVDDRAALFRDRLADRRVLVVLDNARDAGQIRPLLPAAPGCGVVVTSRDRLTAIDDAQKISLDVLSRTEGAALFRSVVGALRLAREAHAPATVARIVEQCGWLPLAIRIAAARHRANRLQTLDDIEDLLSEEHERLAELDDGDRSVAASFAVSHADLGKDPRRLFALIAAHPGPDLDIHAAAALVGMPALEVKRLLTHLVDRNLIGQPERDRYRFHDLVGVFAREYALPEVPELDRAAGLHRLVDYYLWVAEKADTTITPYRFRMPLEVTHHPASLPDLRGYDSALAWLATELPSLVGACRAAADNGLDAQCWQLAYALRGFFFLTKRWEPWLETHELALDAARRLGDVRAEATTVNNLGLAAIEQGQHAAAASHYRRALRLFQEAGDAHGEHTAVANLAWIAFFEGRYADFLRDSRRTLDYYRRCGAHRNAAITLRGVALAQIETGQVAAAIVHLHEVLDLFERLGLRLDVAMTLNCLGEAHERSGEPDRAVEHHQRAVDASRHCGSTYELARAHHRLGHLAAAAGDRGGARVYWKHALDGYCALDAPQQAELRARLAALEL